MEKQFQPLEDRHKKQAFKSWEIHHQSVETKKDEEANASQQIEEEICQLRKQAYEEGLQQGMDESKQKIEALQQNLAYWVSIFAQPAKQIEESIKGEIVDCIFWICKHCLHVELSLHPEKIQAIIEDALLELPSLREGKTIFLNHDDLEWIEENLLPKDRSQIMSIASQDTSLEPGEFYIRDELSEVDGRLETRLKKILQQHIPKKSTGDEAFDMDDLS